MGVKIDHECESLSNIHPLISKLFPSTPMKRDMIGLKKMESLNDKLAQVVHVMEQRAVERRETPRRNNEKKDDNLCGPAVKTIIGLTSVPVGGSLMSLRDEKGHESVLIGYTRPLMVRASRSPFTLLPPPTMKDIVENVPEIVARFPQRHPQSRSPIMEDD